MSKITIPATGSGDATPGVQTDLVGGAHYQQVKIVDGTVGGSVGAVVDPSGNLRVAMAAATALVGASVANFPATQSTQGYVGASVANLPAVQPVSGSVSVVNQPGTQPVSIASYLVTQPVSIASASITQPVSITSGSVAVTNLPAVQTVNVASTVAQTLTGLVGASVTNFPATQQIQGFIGASITNAGALSAASQVLVGGSTTVYVASQAPQTLSGLVGASVTNFPGTQPVSGSVAITNQPGTQPISIASYTVTQPVSIASTSAQIGVSNFPAIQSVQGLVGASVSNLPVTQPVSGSVSVVNFPATQQITGSVALASSTIQVGVSVANFPVNIGSVTTFPAAAAVGGASPYHYVSGASVNQNVVKAAAGTVYTLAAMNQNTSQRYLKLFDKSTVPSPGVDHPVQTYMIPGASAGAGAVIPLPVGLLFANGIGFAITGNISDTDATAVSASDVVVNLAFM